MGAGQTMGLTAVMLGFRRPGDAQARANASFWRGEGGGGDGGWRLGVRAWACALGRESLSLRAWCPPGGRR
eukprot:68880-Pleurochrysis_carterae.AAC.1